MSEQAPGIRFIGCTYEAHAEAILEIINDAIEHSTAVYDYVPRPPETMIGWFEAKEAGRFPVIGAVGDGAAPVADGAAPEAGPLLGFATYGPFRDRPAYKYSVEHSVYVHARHRGRGIGLELMRRLVAAAEEQQYHAMIGGIDLANAASVALHEKLGFVHAGTIRQAAFKFGRWLDLAFYQLLLDTPERPVDGGFFG